MKRLIRRRAFDQQPPTDSMVQLEELDEADVRHDRCPSCQHYPLERAEGFKKCPQCGSTYKMYNGNGYIIAKR